MTYWDSQEIWGTSYPVEDWLQPSTFSNKMHEAKTPMMTMIRTASDGDPKRVALWMYSIMDWKPDWFAEAHEAATEAELQALEFLLDPHSTKATL
jgi:hypothetical protein